MSWDPLCSERQGADTGELKVLSKVSVEDETCGVFAFLFLVLFIS